MSDDSALHLAPIIDRIVLEDEATALCGFSRVTRWRMEKEDRFPRRVKVCDGKIGWRMSDIQRWLSELSNA